MMKEEMIHTAKSFLADPAVGILYGLLTLVYQIIYIIVPMRIAIQQSALSWISPSLAIFGFALLVLTMLADPGRYKGKEMLLPWLLILVLLLSTIVNHERGMRANISTIIWQANLLLLVFPSCVRGGEGASKSRADGRVSIDTSRTVRHTVYFLLLMIDIAVAWSLLQYFQLSYCELLTDEDFYHFGLFEGRLFGVFTTPYVAALINVYAVAASLFYALSSKGKVRLFLVVSCILSTTMIILSGTRSVMLGILLSIAVVVTMILINRDSGAAKGERRILRGMLAVLLALSVSAGVCLIQMGYSRALQGAAAVLNGASGESGDYGGISNEGGFDRNNLERKDTSGNISSNRFGIWQDYVHVLMDRPEKLPLGYSPCGYMEYINEQYPELFIVEYFKEKYPLYYFVKHSVYDPHNSVLNVIISTGFAGLVLLAAFAVKTLKQIFQRYRRGKFQVLDYCILVMLFTTAIAMMFETDVFYQCNTTSVVFWMITGFCHGRYHSDGGESLMGDFRLV